MYENFKFSKHVSPPPPPFSRNRRKWSSFRFRSNSAHSGTAHSPKRSGTCPSRCPFMFRVIAKRPTLTCPRLHRHASTRPAPGFWWGRVGPGPSGSGVTEPFPVPFTLPKAPVSASSGARRVWAIAKRPTLTTGPRLPPPRETRPAPGPQRGQSGARAGTRNTLTPKQAFFSALPTPSPALPGGLRSSIRTAPNRPVFRFAKHPVSPTEVKTGFPGKLPPKTPETGRSGTVQKCQSGAILNPDRRRGGAAHHECSVPGRIRASSKKGVLFLPTVLPPQPHRVLPPNSIY